MQKPEKWEEEILTSFHYFFFSSATYFSVFADYGTRVYMLHNIPRIKFILGNFFWSVITISSALCLRNPFSCVRRD